MSGARIVVIEVHGPPSYKPTGRVLLVDKETLCQNGAEQKLEVKEKKKKKENEVGQIIYGGE